MEIKISDTGSALSISDVVFGRDYNEALVHQVVVAQMSADRAGSAAQKTRSEVRGGGAKPWRQKGTGRARAGTSRSPIWRAGGVTFASKARSYVQKVNKKMYRSAFQVMLSEMVRDDRVVVVDDLSIAEPKTRLLKAKIESLNLDSVLIVSEEYDRALDLAGRNMPSVVVVGADNLVPLDLMRCEFMLIASAAMRKIEERLV